MQEEARIATEKERKRLAEQERLESIRIETERLRILEETRLAAEAERIRITAQEAAEAERLRLEKIKIAAELALAEKLRFEAEE